jgi:hypothetical protein
MATSSADVRRQPVDALLIDRIRAIAAFGVFTEILPLSFSQGF